MQKVPYAAIAFSLLALFVFSALTNAETPEAIPVMKYAFRLSEFSVDAKAYGVKELVNCGATEIDHGLMGKFTLNADDIEKDKNRFLVPSYVPGAQRASWRIFRDEKLGCKGLTPYFNTIGFDAFDINTGKATIYLALFSPKPDDQQQWQGASPAERLQLVFDPELVRKNLILMPATCQLSMPSFWQVLSSTEMNCVLEGGLGHLKLTAQSIEPMQIPQDIFQDIMNDHSLLEGASQVNSVR